MNILPKKRWHVRTKENIARVRKDEAEAAEKDRQEKLRIEIADREARLNVLKLQSKQKLEELGIFASDEVFSSSQPSTSEHINLFSDLDHAVTSTNKEHDHEVKEKTEEYEKKIGYLTYLGQDTNEALKKKNWYEILPESSRFSRTNEVRDTYEKLVLKDPDGKLKERDNDEKDGEVSWKAKQRLDPINAFKEYCTELNNKQGKNRVKKQSETKVSTTISDKYKSILTKKYKKHHKDEKTKKLQKLREARLKREQHEKQKTEVFLARLNGNSDQERQDDKHLNRVKPKYNSQFNPELARQNYR